MLKHMLGPPWPGVFLTVLPSRINDTVVQQSPGWHADTGTNTAPLAADCVLPWRTRATSHSHYEVMRHLCSYETPLFL